MEEKPKIKLLYKQFFLFFILKEKIKQERGKTGKENKFIDTRERMARETRFRCQGCVCALTLSLSLFPH